MVFSSTYSQYDDYFCSFYLGYFHTCIFILLSQSLFFRFVRHKIFLIFVVCLKARTNKQTKHQTALQCPITYRHSPMFVWAALLHGNVLLTLVSLYTSV